MIVRREERGPADEALTVSEVARRLHMSVATVRRRIASGELAAVKLGPRTIRISPEAVAPLSCTDSDHGRPSGDHGDGPVTLPP